MKPIKLEFREMEFNSWITRLNATRKAAQKLLNEVNAIGSYRLSFEHLKLMLEGRHEPVANAVEAATVAELDRVGISSQSVRKAAIKGDLEAFYAIANKSIRDGWEHVEALTITPNGIVNTSAAAIERKREALTSYVRTEHGAKLHELHTAAAEAMEAFYKVAGIFNNLNYRQAFSWGENGKIVPLILDYDTAAKAE